MRLDADRDLSSMVSSTTPSHAVGKRALTDRLQRRVAIGSLPPSAATPAAGGPSDPRVLQRAIDDAFSLHLEPTPDATAAAVQRAPSAGPAPEDRGPDPGPQPPAKPSKPAPPAKKPTNIEGRVVHIEVRGNRTWVMFNRTAADGVEVGMPVDLIGSDSTRLYSQIEEVSLNASFAYFVGDIERVRHFKKCLINAGAKPAQPPVQRHADGHTGLPEAEVHAVAARGIAGSGGSLPHLDTIQRAFGPHDVRGIVAHTDDAAASSARSIGASAYATGHHVAFAGAPDLHTAAHEAAHVVQQRVGVHLAGGVGQEGDPYERHADAVADAVVRGEDATELLSSGPGDAGNQAPIRRAADASVRRKESSIAPAMAPQVRPVPWDMGTERKFRGFVEGDNLGQVEVLAASIEGKNAGQFHVQVPMPSTLGPPSDAFIVSLLTGATGVYEATIRIRVRRPEGTIEEILQPVRAAMLARDHVHAAEPLPPPVPTGVSRRVEVPHVRAGSAWNLGKMRSGEHKEYFGSLLIEGAGSAEVADAVIVGRDASAFRLTQAPADVGADQPFRRPFGIAFFHDKPGTYQATLRVSLNLPNGVADVVDQPLRAQCATDLEIRGDERQAERQQRERAHATEEAVYQADQRRTEPYPQNKMNLLDAARDAAYGAAQALARAQGRGAASIEKGENTYLEARQPVSRSIWWDLLEIAINMATAGVAGVVAKNLAPRLTKLVGVGNSPEDLVQKSIDEAIVLGTTDAMKEGMKSGVKMAMGTKGADKAPEPARPPSGEHSSNGKINFFQETDAVLSEAQKQNHNMIAERDKYLRPLLRTNPDLAIATMSAVHRSLVEAEAVAEAMQAQQTAMGWLAALARAGLGKSTIPDADARLRADPDAITKTTDMASLAQPTDSASTAERRVSILPPSRLLHEFNGMLDIRMAAGGRSPVSARVKGVSQETADVIAQIPLRNAPIPLRIIRRLSGGENESLFFAEVLIRDEAGRTQVFVTDWRGGHGHDARRPVDVASLEGVLEKSLKAWGIEITTNDASGRE